MSDSSLHLELKRLCIAYGVDIVKAEGLKGRYSCVVFTQAYNELHNAADFLENVGHFTDKVVILDDGSTDGTGDEFMSDQVLIHLRRKENSRFNDYDNRSLLMKLGELIDTRWMIFLDLDERIDTSCSTAFKWLLRMKRAEHIRFRFVHLWDNDTHYRLDYPHSNEGVQYRLRMFRKRGKMEIPEKKRLHFEIKPYNSDKVLRSWILILHLGSVSPENRRRRYNLYTTLDPDNRCQSTYEHLISPDAKTKSITTLKMSSFTIILHDMISYLYLVFRSLTMNNRNRKNL